MCCDTTDSQDNMLFEISGLGEETTEMLMIHKDRFEEGTILAPDSKRILISSLHNYIPSKFYKSDSGYSLVTLNRLYSELKTWFKKFRAF